jgi:hypothetical protein
LQTRAVALHHLDCPWRPADLHQREGHILRQANRLRTTATKALTQRHHDLKNEFYDRVKRRGATPDIEDRLRATIVELKKTIANKNEELTQLRADVPALVRVANQLTLESQELRDALAGSGDSVITGRVIPGRAWGPCSERR